jgi:hypothetical protein
LIITNQIAAMGLYPGWETFMVATLGHWFGAELEIEDIGQGTRATASLIISARPGAPGAPGLPQVIDLMDLCDLDDSRRCVKITVKLKKYSWTDEMKICSIVLNKTSVSVTGVRQIREKLIEVLAELSNRPTEVTMRAYLTGTKYI